MTALFTGIVIILIAIYSVIPGIPWGLQWGGEVLLFLKGALPVLAFLVGLLTLFIGIADLRDKASGKQQSEEDNRADTSGE